MSLASMGAGHAKTSNNDGLSGYFYHQICFRIMIIVWKTIASFGPIMTTYHLEGRLLGFYHQFHAKMHFSLIIPMGKFSEIRLFTAEYMRRIGSGGAWLFDGRQ